MIGFALWPTVSAGVPPVVTVGKASTVRQYKKFSGTDSEFFWTVGI